MPLGWMVLLWAALALGTQWIFWWRELPSSGLLLAYLLGFAQLHWLAVALYLNPAYAFYNLAVVRAGFQQSLYGICAFMLGSVLVAPRAMEFLARRISGPRSAIPGGLAITLYFGVGAASFLLLRLTRLSQAPSISAVLASGEQFIVAGLCLSCYAAVRKKRYVLVIFSLAAAMLLPYVTLLTQGFMSFGAAAAMVVFAFAGSMMRSKWLLAAGGLLLTYLGLSVYVGYMRDRTNLRNVIWGGGPIQSRLSVIAQSLGRFEWFDPQNEAHCERIDMRLNQNVLVGAAVTRLEGTDYYAHGNTLRDGILAIIPRALWPDKPMVAGSGTLVFDYTGIHYAQGTSFGVGQVLELFINFGTAGVICGFFLIGTLVTICDWMAGGALACGNWPLFAVWLLSGMCLLNIIGSFVETFSAAATTLILTMLTKRLVMSDRQQHGTSAEL